MPISALSSVSSTRRTSSVVDPSPRTMIQSAPPGSTVPRNRSPTNFPPDTRPIRRLPLGVAPIACMPATLRVIVIRCAVRISAIGIPAFQRFPPSIRPDPERPGKRGLCVWSRNQPSASISSQVTWRNTMPTEYPLPSSEPASLGFATKPLEHLDRLIKQHIEDGRYPGAQIALARHGQLALFRTYGDAAIEPTRKPAT